MKFGQVDQELGTSEDGGDGTMSPHCSFAQHRHEECISCERNRVFTPSLWSDTERDKKKLSSADFSIWSVLGATWV